MSAQLWQIIANNDLQALPAAIIHAELTAKTTVVRTSFFLTFNQVNLIFPPEIAQGFAAKIVQLAGSSAWWAMLKDTLCNVGVDLSLDQTQAMLDTLTGEFGAEIVGQLKSLGVRYVSLLDQAGIAEPSVDDIARVVSDRATIMALRDKSNAISERIDAVYAAWESGQTQVIPQWSEVVG